MTDTITLTPFRLGTRDYTFADRLDVDRALADGDLTERNISAMERQSVIGPLTPERFRLAYERRRYDAPDVPYGFTRAGLEAMGFTLRETGPKTPPAPAAPTPAESTVIEQIELGPDAIAYAGQMIQPRKNGKFTIFSVTDAQGRLLRAKGFQKLEKAQTYLDELAARAPAATPDDEEADAADESEDEDDDRDLQSDAGGSGEQSPPAPG